MKRILLILGFMIISITAQAAWLTGSDKGKRRTDFNVTVTSYTATAIIAAADADLSTDWDIVNNGSYDIFISPTASFDTAAATCRKIAPGASYSPQGKNTSAVWALTQKATANTSRVDGSLYKE